MSTNKTGDSKTVWDKTAEQEWVDEQWAAGGNRPTHQSPGLRLRAEAAAALGNKSPQLAWLEVTDLVTQALDEHWKEAEALGRQLSIGELSTDPRHLSELHSRALALNPIFAINEFNYVNPEIKLDNPRLWQKITPLQALRAVIRMWTANNHRSEAL